MPDAASFLFVTCQVGAEPALKGELAHKWPAFRFAYSRPGFLTFKLPAAHTLADDFDLHSVFARAYGFSLSKATETRKAEDAGGEDAAESTNVDLAGLARQVWEAAGDRPFESLHVWQRDAVVPGYRGFEPGRTDAAAEAQAAILAARPAIGGDADVKPLAATALPGQLVLDCILVEPGEWWIGYHRARSVPSRWPGGVPDVQAPPDMVSRAYLKMEEALAWSRLPVEPGQQCVEIGSAPGGASQCLLDHGLAVTGVDPAEMDRRILANPNFTHVKKRGADIRRRDYRAFRWLTADINVAPAYTLDTVESIVTHPETNIEGLLLTLKLPEWKLAEEISQYLDRVRAWGYADVRARQLAHNRQEIAVAALKSRTLRKRAGGRTPRREKTVLSPGSGNDHGGMESTEKTRDE